MGHYPGGKNAHGTFHRIINLIPPHQVYVEPFLGSGAVMRIKRPAELNIGLDRDSAVVMEFTKTLPRSAWWRTGTAAWFLGKNGAVSERRRRRSPKMTGTTVPDGSGEVRSRSVLLAGDALDFLRRYPFVGHEVVYCDPPYLPSARRGTRPLYDFELTEEQHAELLGLLVSLPCRVILSGYASVLYKRWLRGWRRVEFEAFTRHGPALECLWTNYPEPVELHDYRFLGEGYRERERIKRKTARWVARLERMDLLERRALLAAIAHTGSLGDGAHQ